MGKNLTEIVDVFLIVHIMIMQNEFVDRIAMDTS